MENKMSYHDFGGLLSLPREQRPNYLNKKIDRLNKELWQTLRSRSLIVIGEEMFKAGYRQATKDITGQNNCNQSIAT
jgi:hypothetical protein